MTSHSTALLQAFCSSWDGVFAHAATIPRYKNNEAKGKQVVATNEAD
jgi:hypothetical protein